MSLPLLLRVSSGLILAIFALATFGLVQGTDDEVGLVLWLASPNLVALLVLLVARDTPKLWAASAANAAFCILGAIVFPSGGARGLFLPALELLLLAMLFSALWLSRRGKSQR